jgi:hypothetical protein
MAACIVNSLASGRICPTLRAQGTPCVLLAHEMAGLLGEKGLLPIAARALATATEVVVAAREIAMSLARATGFDEARAVVLPQGCYRTIRFCRTRRAALRQRLGVGCDDILVLGLGYADTRKGFDLFVQLWRLLSPRARRTRAPARVHFLWAGGIDPNLKCYLGAELEAAIETGTFHLSGFLDDPSDVLSAADCHALTSREDPYPSVVLEAIAAGLETVAFEGTGGIPALLRREAAGHVVARGDLAAFGQALITAGRKTRIETRERRIADGPAPDFDDYARRLLMMTRPGLIDVSVAVLSFNYAHYLRQRLDSVLSQSHPVREVIVLDDASTDGSVECARSVAIAAGRQIEIVVAARNSGSPFHQWRSAAEKARGEWLWIAEADDAAEPGFLGSLAGLLATCPDAVLGFTDSRMIDEKGTPVGSSYAEYYRQSGCVDLTRDGVHDGPEFLRRCLSERNMILNASAVLFRRSALSAALERCRDDLHTLSVAGDWRVYVEMLAVPSSKLVYLASPLNVHRRHERSVTHRLAARRHLVEIGQVHAAVARLGGISLLERGRQRAYRRKLRSEFGLKAATR